MPILLTRDVIPFAKVIVGSDKDEISHIEYFYFSLCNQMCKCQ